MAIQTLRAGQKLVDWIQELQETAHNGHTVSITMMAKVEGGNGTLTIDIHPDGHMTWDGNPYTVFTPLKWKEENNVTIEDIKAISPIVESVEGQVI